MTILQALLLSIVEGITEFLPISSTGHLILATKFLKIPPSDFVSSFNIAIQLGAILSVVFLYRHKFLHSINLYKKIGVSFVPTMVIGLVLYKLIKHYLLNNSLVTLLAMFIGGILLIIIEKKFASSNKFKSLDSVPYPQALALGVFQSLAVIPGVSRSAATIIGGLFLGLDRSTAVEYSFLLAVPTMMAATILDLFETSAAFTQQEFFILMLGTLGSFVVALAAVSYFLKFVQHHTFVAFGVYRIMLALAFLLLVGI